MKDKIYLVGLDIPLLYETKTNKICNYILLASASESTQKDRVLSDGSGAKAKAITKINKNQLSDCFKRKQKPIIISTEFGKTITFISVIFYIILINFKLGINK